MLWYFVVVAFLAYLLFLAISRRIDSATSEMKQIVDTAIENLKPKEKEEEGYPENHLEARIRKEVYQDCPRYGIQDPYTIAELTRCYTRGTSQERIRLLARVYRQGVQLPYELALKAVTDTDASVREWMAQNAQYIDYREAQYKNVDGKSITTYLYPDRNLVDRLRQDLDPFVRAALRENSEVSDFGYRGQEWVEEFKRCTPLERLAMMRNKKLHFELVRGILDVDEATLNLEKEERFQLARACLVNTHVVQNARRSRTMDFADGWAWHEAGKNAREVWELAAKWPEDSGIQFMAFKHVQTDDKVKADICSKCRVAHLRSTILESCLPEDKVTLRLGREDADSAARFIAYGRTRFMEKRQIEDALRREEDNWVAAALLENPWLGAIAREINETITKS